MRVEINLSYNKGFKWFSSNDIYVKGYLFDANNNLYKEELLIKYFENINSTKEFKQKLIEANGIFSVVIKQEKQTFIAVDRTRTFPLFYTQSDDILYISDDSFFLKDINMSNFDNNSKEEFLCTGFVIGEKTLLDNVYQLQASEFLIYQNKKLNKFIYFFYSTSKIKENNFIELQTDLFLIFERMIQRLIKSIENRRICIPLSGGYDSRIIAVLLKKYNYNNVLCFTYGKKNSYEVKISKKVAKRLGFSWYFIEYSECLLKKCFQDKNFINFVYYASQHTSIPHIQDFCAIRELVEKKIIDKNTVFVTGHSGDLYAGTGILKRIERQLIVDDISQYIYSKHFSLCKKNKINNYNKILTTKNNFLYSSLDDWNIKERQAKFIINSHRTYEFYGYEHRIPLWDKEIVLFFKYVNHLYKNRNLNYRLNNNLYDSTIFKYFKEYNVSFKLSKKRIFIYKLTFKLKIYRPDYNNFNYIKEIFNISDKLRSINSVIAEYTLKLLKKR